MDGTRLVNALARPAGRARNATFATTSVRWPTAEVMATVLMASAIVRPVIRAVDVNKVSWVNMSLELLLLAFYERIVYASSSLLC